MIDATLINNALVLTDKKIEDMFEIQACLYYGTPLNGFSIEKFCYYLLSPEFIEKYYPIAKSYLEEKYFPIDYNTEEENKPVYFLDISKAFGEAIYEYQKGDEETLSNLLSKI